MMTETKVEVELAMAFTEYIPNVALAEIASEAMQEIGAPQWEEDDYKLAKEYLESYPEQTKAAIWETVCGEVWRPGAGILGSSVG